MVMKYYTSKDWHFTISKPFNPNWVSLCHNQPQMDNIPIFLDIENEEAFGVCRRCGNQSKLTNAGLFWLKPIGGSIHETTSPM